MTTQVGDDHTLAGIGEALIALSEIAGAAV